MAKEEIKNLENAEIEKIRGINFATGEEIEYDKQGRSLSWNFSKQLVNRNDRNGAYRVNASLILDTKEVNGVRHQMKLNITFNEEEIDVVNFYGNGFFEKLNTKNTTQQNLLTRFVFGKTEETGAYYLMAIVSICQGKVIKRVKFSYSQNEMFNDAYNNGYPFKIVADERAYEFEKEDDLSTAL